MKYTDAMKYLPLINAMAAGKIIQANRGDARNPKWVTLKDNVEFSCEPELYRIREPEEVQVEEAYELGHMIQVWDPKGERWVDCTNAPLFWWHRSKYRVKPKLRTRYMVEIAESNRLWGTYTSLEQAEIGLALARAYDKRYQLVEYQEVLK